MADTNVAVLMKGITKVYPNGIAANQGVDFSVKKGEIHALMGENGAGKSTLMKMVAGLVAPSEGRIELFGSSDSEKQRIRIGSFIEEPGLYPGMTATERETAAAKEYGAIFIIGIGAPLSNGEPHDGRAPDYDDWISPNSDGYSGLNGDIVLYDSILDRSFEISSMGVRVSPESLMRQLEARGCTDRCGLNFHRSLLAGELPYSIGGGIGQSRLCMFLLQKAHIGEVQASIWSDEQIERCRECGIELL